MTKKLMVMAVCLAVSFGISLAQTSKTYTTKATNSGSECTFTGKTYDEVWGAAASVILNMKYNLTVAQKDTGVMAATKAAGAGSKFVFGFLAKDKNINLIFKNKDNDVCVSCNLKVKNGVVSVFEDMAKILYAK